MARNTGDVNVGQKLTRDDWKKKKELEEARKAGTAPAEVDEEGRDINPHIPQYISQAPWYASTGGPTLKHQRPQEQRQKQYSSITEWYKRGTSDSQGSAVKYRKGACENCGSMTHSKKDCVERPRKIGAKYTHKDIKPDEAIQPMLSFDYDGKRDRWNGYDADEHRKVIEEYTKVELAKRQLNAEKLQQELASGQLSEETVKKTEDGGDSKDEDKYADAVDMPGTKFDSKTRITVRNLRIREDTAKYLYNLDPNSAFYDPKTRSMRENPFQNMNKDPSELKYAGDNFVRHSGDTKNFAKSQMFAWEATDHGTDIHPQAEPTQLTMMHKEFKKKKEDFKSDLQQSILDKYGGKEHLDAPPKELLLAQTEHYIEYSRLGNVIKGQEKAVAKSRYEEDVLINNHTSVWGSYWEGGQWGYACCHSFLKSSYCTGESGKLARKAVGKEKQVVKVVDEPMKGNNNNGGGRKRSHSSVKAESSGFPTEEELDEYHRTKQLKNDPMAQFMK